MKRNRYGYKICYCEKDSKIYICYFMTYSYKQAKFAINGYIRYPPTARKDGHKLKNPTWKIIPISKDEVIAGIWREDPF